MKITCELVIKNEDGTDMAKPMIITSYGSGSVLIQIPGAKPILISADELAIALRRAAP